MNGWYDPNSQWAAQSVSPQAVMGGGGGGAAGGGLLGGILGGGGLSGILGMIPSMLNSIDQGRMRVGTTMDELLGPGTTNIQWMPGQRWGGQVVIQEPGAGSIAALLASALRGGY
ncbi:MAG: hypothetical protein EP301_07380 [Gammaproteobacteria bacterium]|nr:MAG: hypothetical protein EP301_07380 [Gammaproteobacteria bacterium]